MKHARPRPRFNVAKIITDMTVRGWNAFDLAKAAGKDPVTINTFLAGQTQTPKTAAAIAAALGYSPRRYFSHVEAA